MALGHSPNVKVFTDGTWGYAAMTVAPTIHGTCDATLMQVVTFPSESCGTVRETHYKQYQYKGQVAGKAVYQRNGAVAALEELTGSCIVILYETLFSMPK